MSVQRETLTTQGKQGQLEAFKTLREAAQMGEAIDVMLS